MFKLQINVFSLTSYWQTMETFRGCESGVKEHEENMTSFEATEESPRRLDTLPYDVLLRLMDHIPSGDLQRGIYATNKQLRGILCQEDFWKNRLKSRCQECRVIQRTGESSFVSSFQFRKGEKFASRI